MKVYTSHACSNAQILQNYLGFEILSNLTFKPSMNFDSDRDTLKVH